MEFWNFLWSLLCYTLVSVLVLGIGIARGQYYWILGAYLGIVLTLLYSSELVAVPGNFGCSLNYLLASGTFRWCWWNPGWKTLVYIVCVV